MSSIYSSAIFDAADPTPELLYLVVRNGGTVDERFRLSWRLHLRAGGWPQRSRDLAAALDVHPTALSPSNFKLTPTALATAAHLFGVTTRFLISGDLSPEMRPAWLNEPSTQVALARAAGQRVRLLDPNLPPMWHEDTVWAILPLERIRAVATPAELGAIDAAAEFLQTHARQRQLLAPAISLSRDEWQMVLTSLSQSAVDGDAALDDPRLQLAARIHQQIGVVS